MAARYWTGGASTIDWNATSPKTNWGTASNTQDNASIPTEDDDVYFDGVGSGDINCFIPDLYDVYVKSFDCTGYTQRIIFGGTSYFYVYGNTFKLNSSMSLRYNTFPLAVAAGIYSGTQTFVFSSTSGTVQVTTANNQLGEIVIDVGGTWQLQDNFTNAFVYGYGISLLDGILDFNNKTVTTFYVTADSGTLLLGSSTIKLRSWDGIIWYCSPLVSVTCGTSLIYADVYSLGSTYNGTRIFYGGGKTYYNLEFDMFGDASGGLSEIHDSNTFNSIIQDTDWDIGSRISIESDTTQTVSSLSLNGRSSTYRLSLGSTSTSAHIISCASGTITANHITISYSTASGGATFSAGPDGIDSGNNTGWDFPDIYSYSGAITTSIVPGSAYVECNGYPYSGSITLDISPTAVGHKNSEWNGNITIGISPSYERTIDVSYAGSINIGISPSHSVLIDINRTGSLAFAIGISSVVSRLNSTYYPYNGNLSIPVGLTSTVIIRKKLNVKDPVVIGGCPRCGTYLYNR